MPVFAPHVPADIAPTGAPLVRLERLVALLRPLYAGWVKDPRDVVFLDVVADATIRHVPLGLFVLLAPIPWWITLALAPLYWFWTTRGIERVLLMLHAAMHRPAFSAPWVEAYVMYFLPIFYGQTPFTFQMHHLAMHHREDNGPNDLSSTLPYERDNVFHWFVYAARFLFLSVPDFTIYFVRSRRYRWLRSLFAGEVGYFFVVLALAWWNWSGALVVIVLPVFVMRCMMMAGNFAQHALVDPADPTSNIGNSTTLLNSSHNPKCFNDGYHITHHEYPAMHWSEMPASFEAHRVEYARQGAVAFQGIGSYVELWTYLMRRDYGGLADRYVHLGEGPEPSRAEIMALLKARTRPLGAVVTKGVAAAVPVPAK